MRKWANIVCTVAFLAVIAWQFFDSLRYFTPDRDFFYLLAFIASSVPMALLYNRFSPRAKWRARLVAYGVSTFVLSALVWRFGLFLVSVSKNRFTTNGKDFQYFAATMLAIIVVINVMAAIVGYWFVQEWKKRPEE